MDPADTTVVLLDLPAEITRVIVRAAGKSAGVVCRNVCRALHEMLPVPAVFRNRLCEKAAEENLPEVLKWAVSAGYGLYGKVDYWITCHGTSETLQWLCDQGFPKNTAQWMENAASAGNLDVVRWLDKNGERITPIAKMNVVKNGHTHIMQYIHDNGYTGIDAIGLNTAIERGYLHVVKWLYEHEYQLRVYVLQHAIRCKQLVIIEWLWDKIHPMELHFNISITNGIETGNLDICKFLHSKRISIFADSANLARRLGHTDIAEWIESVLSDNPRR